MEEKGSLGGNCRRHFSFANLTRIAVIGVSDMRFAVHAQQLLLENPRFKL